MGVQLFLIFILTLGKCTAYIYRLNGSEYSKMPPIFHLDLYDTCLHEHNDSGVYCHVNFDLITEEPSELYTMIKDYSDKTEIHFNHSKLSYGICLTKTCKKFYQDNKEKDHREVLEACLNESMWEHYKLKTLVNDDYTCENLKDKKYISTTFDTVVVILIAVLLILNCVGSLQELLSGNTENLNANGFLSCFSISRNWRKLVAPGAEGPDPRMTRLVGFYGLKAITIMLVIAYHSTMPYLVDPGNTRDIDDMHFYWYYRVLGNGTVIVQTFFFLSGFLLSYNVLIYEEKHTLSLISAPQIIIMRWLRLTPPYAVVLAVIATWVKYCGSGPLWQSVVMTQVEDCQQDWWRHLLFVNNYMDDSHCMNESWYLAADFQLCCLGVLVLVLTAGRRSRHRRNLLAALFVCGLLMTILTTYVYDLEGHLLAKPESGRKLYTTDPTFNYFYKRTHTNLITFVIGLSVGLLVYHRQTSGYKGPASSWHRLIVWLSVPAVTSMIMASAVFYRDAPRAPLFIRILYSSVSRPVFASALGYFVFAMVFEVENVYRSILEWGGWAVFSRTSYCAYLLHMTMIRVLTGTRTATVHFSILHVMEIICSSVVLSFLAALFLHLLVEAPFLQLLKLITTGNNSGKRSKDSEHEKQGNGIHKVVEGKVKSS